MLYNQNANNKLNNLLIISSMEFKLNQEKYLHQVDESIETIITLAENKTYKFTREIDNDLASAITAEELLVGIEEDIRAMFKRKN